MHGGHSVFRWLVSFPSYLFLCTYPIYTLGSLSTFFLFYLFFPFPLSLTLRLISLFSLSFPSLFVSSFFSFYSSQVIRLFPLGLGDLA